MNADNRKGELVELKTQLRLLAGSRAPGVEDVKRELYKKVISYMTIGIDVSSLFSEMVMCSATSDLVLKKMCYLYVGNYARGHPDLALLTINFLQKDCQDDNPMIRGLALRSLCSLRVKNLVEYLVRPLQAGLKDYHGYVRMVAAMGVLKLYQLAPAACLENDFPATLKALLLNDSEAQVMANCLSALLEIFGAEAAKSESGRRDREYLFSRTVIFALLNRIKEFSEWAQCLVLDIITKYVPSDANEIFDIMNLLEDRLQHANSAVVLATIKVFLQMTMSMADVHQQVYERIKAPLLTLVSSGSAEQSYAVLAHLHLLVIRAPVLFADDYKHFYCRYSEPSYVKRLKLEMLTAVANSNNTYEIDDVMVCTFLLMHLMQECFACLPVTELSEYAANVDVAIARESIRAVGKIALEQYDVNAIVDRLLQFLEMEKDYVTAETLVLIKDLLRKYPQWSHDCIAVVGNVSSKTVQEPRAKAALVWMLGEYAYDMEDAPYVLEGFVESWTEEDSAEVRLELLTAAMKIFFKRPPESQKILGNALVAGLADAHQDVHDRALLYYRLLQQGVEIAERVVSPQKQAVSVFADRQSSEIKDRIFDEFNSLAVVYHEPSYMFLDKEHRPLELSEDTGPIAVGPTSSDEVLPSQSVDASDNDLLLSAAEKEEDSRAVSNGSYEFPGIESSHLGSRSQSPVPSVPVRSSPLVSISSTSAVPATSTSNVDDLLGFGDLTLSVSPSPPTLKLVQIPALDPTSFKRKWSLLPVAQALEIPLPQLAASLLTGSQPLVRHMQANSIQCMATGGQAPKFRFFFYAQSAEAPSGSGFFLVELQVTSPLTTVVKLKADDSTLTEAFVAHFRSTLAKFGACKPQQ